MIGIPIWIIGAAGMFYAWPKTRRGEGDSLTAIILTISFVMNFIGTGLIVFWFCKMI